MSSGDGSEAVRLARENAELRAEVARLKRKGGRKGKARGGRGQEDSAVVADPAGYERKIRRVERKLERLRVEYRWAYGAAYSRQVVEGPYEARVTVGVNETGVSGLASDNESLKRAMAAATALAESWYAEVLGAVRSLELGLASAERRHGGLFEGGYEPRVPEADIVGARAAAERRRARGEVVP